MSQEKVNKVAGNTKKEEEVVSPPLLSAVESEAIGDQNNENDEITNFVHLDNNQINNAVTNFTNAFESLFIPEFESISSQLVELSQSQQILLDIVKEQNEEWNNLPHLKEFEQIFSLMPIYSQKIHHLKQEMQFIQDKMSKMKLRSDKLLK
ncbi:hypothetical protein ABK040_002337 [Willaertia magna]